MDTAPFKWVYLDNNLGTNALGGDLQTLGMGDLTTFAEKGDFLLVYFFS